MTDVADWSSSGWGTFPWGAGGDAPPPSPLPGVPIGLLDRPSELPPLTHKIVGPNGLVDYPETVGSFACDEDTGFANATGIVEADRVISQPDIYQDGATWYVMDSDTGDIVFAGDLYDPAIGGGNASLKAEGWGHRPLRQAENLPYQVRGYSNVWLPRNSEPFGATGDGYYVQGEENFTLSTDGALRCNVKKGTDMTDGDTVGWILWREGFDPGWVRIAGHIHVTTSGLGYELRILVADGPVGGLGSATTVTLPGGGLFDKDFDVLLAVNKDLINVEIHRTSTATLARNDEITITQLRVNGIAPGDVFTGSDVARDIAGREGMSDALIQNTAANVLPLDVVDGQHADALDLAAIISGAYWRGVALRNGQPALEWAPWGSRTWEIIDPEFPSRPIPRPRYDSVLVPYLQSNGKATGMLEVKAAKPLPVSRVYGPISLSDPLPDSVNARVLGEQLLTVVYPKRQAGSVTFSRMVDERSRVHTGHAFRAQDSITLPSGVTLRTKAARRSGGTIEADFDDGETVVNRILARRARRLAVKRPQ